MWAEETQEEDKKNPSRRSEKILRLKFLHSHRYSGIQKSMNTRENASIFLFKRFNDFLLLPRNSKET